MCASFAAGWRGNLAMLQTLTNRRLAQRTVVVAITMVDARIIHGDCLDVLPTLPEQSVALMFCDLPYGVTAADWDVQLNLAQIWKEMQRTAKENAAYLFTATQPFANAVINSMPSLFKYDLLWDKAVTAAIGCARHRPLPYHEGIYVFGKRVLYNPQMVRLKKPNRITAGQAKGNCPTTGLDRTKLLGKTYTHTYPSTILRFPVREYGRGLHSTQKPLALLRYLIRTYSNPGDTVLDPTCGSGTTLVAALLEGRHSIGIEKDATIFANARERVMAVRRSLRPKDNA